MIRGLWMVPVFALSIAASPGWVDRKGHPSYAKDEFWLGVGSASITGNEKNDVDAAEASARKDLLAQIQVTVKGESEAYVEEQTKNGQAYDRSRFTDRTVQSVAGTLEGVRIADSFVDGKTKTRWALAVVDRRQAAQGVASGIEATNAKIREAFSKADDAKTGDAALRAILEVFPLADQNEANAVLYRAMTRKNAEATGSAELREKVASLAFGLSLSVKRGDDQPATSGGPLPEPISFHLAAGAVPYAGVPLVVRLDGPGSVTPKARTGADGLAEVKASEVKSTGAPEGHVIADVDWSAWLKDRGSKDAPERIGLPKLSASMTYRFATVVTTRVLVAVDERIVWKDNEKSEAPKNAISAPKISDLLSQRGLDVRPIGSFGGWAAADVAKALPADLKDKLAKNADVVVTGAIVSEYASRMCDDCPTFHIAKGVLRAIDMRTGRVLAEIEAPGKKGMAENETFAGTVALTEAAKSAAPLIVEALVKALERK